MHRDLVVDSHAPQPALHAAIASACRELLPGWAALQQVDITLITGGISNSLFKVSPGGGAAAATAAAAALAPVAFRIYGDNTEQFIDRSRELGIMRLAHEYGFGPRLLATFSNGRIEEFLPMRSLQPEEMAAPQFVPAIAATLRRFHAIPAAADQLVRTPFARIYEWLDIAQQFVFDDPEKQRAFAGFDFAAMRAEVAAVEAAAAALHSPVAFCHNDLLSGNIMVPLKPAADAAAGAGGNGGGAQPPPMTFIDFEYSERAPRGFDLGNHFCEYAGFEGDYTRYPTPQQAKLFIRHYLAAGGGGGGGGADAVGEAELARCVAEANVYALAAHQYWGTWSFLQAKWSKIDFNYLEYAGVRWGEYHRRKAEFLARAAAAAAATVGRSDSTVTRS